MQLSAAQLAAAASAPAGKAVKELVCFDTSSAIGALPTLALARVCTSEGASLEGKDKIALFTMMLPLVLALGQGTQETMEDFLRGAETQEHGSTGAIAARKAFGARAFMGEVLEVLREFVKETGTYVVLPALPSSGKAPARESGAAPPAPATAAPGAAAAVPVAAAVPTAAPAAAAAASASAAPAPAVTPTSAGASSSAIATAQQQQAANHKVMVSADDAYMGVVQAESGHAEVRSAFLKVLQVTRNADRVFSWHDLRRALVAAHTIMVAVGESAGDIKIVSDTVARGDRLVVAFGPTYGARAATDVLDMFTGLLPNAHGVPNDLFSADYGRIRKSASVAGMSAAMGTALGLPVVPAPFPTFGPGGGAFGIHPSPVSLQMALQPGVQQQTPRQSRRQARSSGATHGVAGHYTQGPPGRGEGGRGKAAGGGATGVPSLGGSASHHQMLADVRNQRNLALQQRQMANPGVPGQGETCHKCRAANRDPNHSHLTCAFWICGNCKEAGHRRAACPNPTVP